MRIRKRLIAPLIVATLLSYPLVQANGAIKAGAACVNVGQIKKVKGLTYQCTKSKKKQTWKKVSDSKKVKSAERASTPTPSAIPTSAPSPTPIPSASPTTTQQTFTPTPSPTSTPRNWNSLRSTDDGYIYDYNSWCDVEKDLTGTLKAIEDAYLSASRCSGIYRVAKYQLGSERPRTLLTNSASDLPVSQCQISEPADSRNYRGFPNLFPAQRKDYYSRVVVPGPQMTIQVVPIYSTDTAKPVGNPKDDYSVYWDFLKEWAEYATDGKSNVQISIPSEYLKFSKEVSTYGIMHDQNHDHPENVRFVRELTAEIDSHIDFSGVNAVMVIVPPGTPLKNFQQAALKNFPTQEGIIDSGTSVTPLTLTSLDTIRHPNFLTPYWFLHELFHVGIGLDDHYGDGNRNVNTEYGLGWWTLMTPWGGELSAWEKWLLGFTKDSQVHCLSASQTNTRWIAPSSVKTDEKKMIVIPLSQTKGIIIESIRPGGLYYKIPKSSSGVLVYVADLQVQGHGLGLKLVLPTNRNPNPNNMFLSEATLREGESVTTNGVKITIVETGNFGDVVKVEPIAVSGSVSFRDVITYGISEDSLTRKSASGDFFSNDERTNAVFDQIRVAAFQAITGFPKNFSHPKVKLDFEIRPSFPKSLLPLIRKEISAAAALWNDVFDEEITVKIYLVTEQDRDYIKGIRWLQLNLPDKFDRFDKKNERTFISGGGGYWDVDGRGNEGRIFLATASYFDANYATNEWPQVARHEFVHVVQDYMFRKLARERPEAEVEFDRIQNQSFREGSANTISFHTAFPSLGWASDALDARLWQIARYTSSWKQIRSEKDAIEVMQAIEFRTPDGAFEMGYPIGALMYEWFISTYGMDGYIKLLRQLASAETFEAALRASVGIAKEDFYLRVAPYVLSTVERINPYS